MKDKIQSYRPSRGFIIALGIVLLPICLFIPTAYRDRSFICENTVSKKGYREWCCGLKTGQWYLESPLESFMREHYPKEMEHRWKCFASTEGNFLGFTRRGGHGRPGPVILLSDKVLVPYMGTVADSEKKTLYDLFASTNRPAIDAKVNEIFEKVLDSE